MLNRFLTVKRKCRNSWELQPRNERGWWLPYDGSPVVSKAALEAAKRKRSARARASAGAAIEALVVENIIRLLVVAPPPVQLALVTKDLNIGYV